MSTHPFTPRSQDEVLADREAAVERWALDELDDVDGQAFDECERQAQQLWSECVQLTDGFTDMMSLKGRDDLQHVVRSYLKANPSHDKQAQFAEAWGVSDVETLQLWLDSRQTFGDPDSSLVRAQTTTRIADNLLDRLKRQAGNKLEAEVAEGLVRDGFLDLDAHWEQLDELQRWMYEQRVFRPDSPGHKYWPRFESVWQQAYVAGLLPCGADHDLCRLRWLEKAAKRSKVVKKALQPGDVDLPGKSFTRQCKFKKDGERARTADLVVQPPRQFDGFGMQLPPRRLVEVKLATDMINVGGKRGNELEHQAGVLSEFGVPVLYMQGTFPESFVEKLHGKFYMVFNVSDDTTKVGALTGQ